MAKRKDSIFLKFFWLTRSQATNSWRWKLVRNEARTHDFLELGGQAGILRQTITLKYEDWSN